MNKRWHRLALLLLLVGLGAAPQPQESITYERYDVDINIQPDGSLLVVETYQIRFEGEFHTGFAEIFLDYVTDVVDVQVREGEQIYTEVGSGPGTFSVDREWDAIYVEWEYEPTSGTEVRTFTVEYRVLGGLRIYSDGDSLSWTAVPEDRSGIPVEASQVMVHMPQTVSPADLTCQSYGVDTRTEILDGQTVVFEALTPIPNGTSLEIEVSFPPGLTAAITPDWQRAMDETDVVYRWQALDVDMTIVPDGTLALTEEHKLAVDEGYLYHGYRQIPWLYLDRITDVEVWACPELNRREEAEQAFKSSSDPCDYCYVVEEEDEGWWVWAAPDGEVIINEDEVGSTLVEWAFPAMGAGDTAIFRLSYTVLGAVRVLTNAQEIAWTVVFADRNVEVEATGLRLHLPPDVSTSDVTVEGGATAIEPDGTLRVTHSGPVPAGEAWSLRIRLPAGTLVHPAEKPRWQYDLESAMEEAQGIIEAERQATVRRARWQLGLGTLGCLFPILGLVGVLVAWYVWGRDRPAPFVSQYLTEPPSDRSAEGSRRSLPAGIVAYLVDEKPTVKGVLADLLHLATLGLISVDLRKSDFTITLNWEEKIGKDKVVRVTGGEEVALAGHERTLFNTLVEAIEKTDQATPFSKIQKTFTRALPTLYEQMGEAATQYFSVQPDEARRRWNWAGQLVVIIAGVLGLTTLCAISSVGPVACAPPVGLAVVGLMLMGVSRWMPQRTTFGVEEAERWRAFRRYLKNLKQYWSLETAQDVLDRYFHYAVALDVEELVLRQAEEMGARVPLWMVPVAVEVGAAIVAEAERRRGLAVHLPSLTRGLRPPQSKAKSLQAAKARPTLAERPAGADLSLDGLASNLGRSLDRATRSLGSLLDAAVGDAESSPFEVVVKGAGEATKITWKAGTSTMKVLGDILETSSSGGGGGGYSGGSSRRSRSSSFRSSSWSSSSSRSNWSPSRSSSSSRRSGGGGRRGFR
jgi:hypothetical protein